MTGFASLSAANPIPDGLLAQAEEHWEQPWSDYLVLADWLLEQGHDDHAECLHWLVRHRRRCYKSFGGNFQWTCTSIWRDPSEIQYRSYLPLVLRPPGFIPLRGSYTHAIREVLSSWTIVKHKQPESIAELLALSVVGVEP